MNLEIEKEIVDNYYQKRCKKRIKWELETPRRRRDAIWKMGDRKYLEEKRLHFVKYMSDKNLILKILEMGGTKRAYYMSIDFIGELTIEEAVRKAREDYWGCIVYFGNGIGYYHEGELEKFPPEYILIK